MRIIKIALTLSLIFTLNSCITNGNESAIKQEHIQAAFAYVKKSTDIDSQDKLLDALAVVTQFHLLSSGGALTPENLENISQKITPENESLIYHTVNRLSLEQTADKKSEKSKAKIKKVPIPELIKNPELSNEQNQLKYVLKNYQFSSEITIPEKFEFNGTSIPGFAQTWLGKPFTKDYEIAGLVHDYLYSNMSSELNYSKYAADLAFYDLLRKNNVPSSKALTMYMGVVLGGGFFYQKD